MPISKERREIEKRFEIIGSIIKGTAVLVQKKGEGIHDNFYVEEGVRDLRNILVHRYYMPHLSHNYDKAWKGYYDYLDRETPPEKWSYHKDIIEWAEDGDREARLYLEIIDLFNH